jgi:tRNA nucleotidyltransferase (CCA-adding enzyme)
MEPILREIRAAGGVTYLVGGIVRDQLLGFPPKDEDYLVTGLPLPELVALLRRHGRTDMVGAAFGVVKFTPDGGPTRDFALPRRERSTGVGHRDFAVEFGHFVPIVEDLLRRDFTCNAIARDTTTGELVDPFGGARDIAARQLKLVRDEAFVEDPLRMLRAVQVSARFDLRPDEGLTSRLVASAPLCNSLSGERVAAELCKLLRAPRPSSGFRYMADNGLLVHILPELQSQRGVPQPARYHTYDVFDHSLVACDSIPAKGRHQVWLRLTALLHDIGKKDTLTFKSDGTPQFLKHDEVGATMAEGLLARLKFAGLPEIHMPVDRVVHLIRHHMFSCEPDGSLRTLRRFVATVGRGHIMDLLRLRIGDRCGKGMPTDVTEWVRLARRLRVLTHGSTAFTVKELAVNGRDLMRELGLKPGPQVGALLNHLLDRVLDEPELNRAETLIALARQRLA